MAEAVEKIQASPNTPLKQGVNEMRWPEPLDLAMRTPLIRDQNSLNKRRKILF